VTDTASQTEGWLSGRPERVDAVLRLATQALERAGIESARADAELLLGSVLEATRGRVQALALTGAELDPEQSNAFRALVIRRAAREPLQHLTGVAGFRGIELEVGPGVFVPRPETEVVAGIAIDALRAVDAQDRRAMAVDLGTGSGAIALAIAAEVPLATVVGVEMQPQAFIWARRNAARLALPNAHIICGDLACALPQASGTVDVVVSNPPYVPDDAIPRDPEVRMHDPSTALYGGADGLDVVRRVVATAERLLRPGGTIVIEHGEWQGAAVRDLLPAPVWHGSSTTTDLTGRDRATTALRS
jgi:release factor glutamine methyltransferase